MTLAGRLIASAAAIAAGLAAFQSASAQTPAAPAAAAPAPRYVSIPLEIHVDKDAPTVWKKLSGYCDIGTWMKVPCVYTSGDGGLGTNRLIAGRVNEILVAKTSTSYTYAQPLAPNSYHGTVEVVPDGAGAKILYTLFYDVAPAGDAKAQADDVARRAKLFTGVLAKMKAIAEAP